MGDLGEGDVTSIDGAEVEKHVAGVCLRCDCPGTGDVPVGRPCIDSVSACSGFSIFNCSVRSLRFEGEPIVHAGEPGGMVPDPECGERGRETRIDRLVEGAEAGFTGVVEDDARLLRVVGGDRALLAVDTSCS